VIHGTNAGVTDESEGNSPPLESSLLEAYLQELDQRLALWRMEAGERGLNRQHGGSRGRRMVSEVQPQVMSASEVEHWIATYTELVLFTQGVMDSSTARSDLQTTETRLLQVFLDDLRDRLALWRMHSAAQQLNSPA
jgi:hypothetical protein